MTREPVQPTPRAPMTKGRRLRIYLACNGRCVCGVKVPMKGTVIDHPTQLWMGGPDEDEFLKFLCGPCVKIKDAKDASARGKVRRILAREEGTRRPRKAIPSRGFDKTKRKRMDGTVVTK